ncbi:MAG: GAF domain-containing protein, partial [Chloroflexi bacterium]
RLRSGQSVYILDAQGKVVAHRNPSVVLRGVTFLPSNQDSIQPGLASVDPASAVATSGGGLIKTLVARLSSPSVVLATDTIQIGEQEITVVSEQTLAEAMALAINTTTAIAGLIIVALAFSASAGLRTVRQIVQPIQSLAAVAQAISAGDLAQQVQIASRDELGVLGNAFNGMTTQLRQTLAGLEQRVADRTQELQSNLQELNLSLKKNQERTAQLEAIADTARSIASLQSLDQLLAGITELVSERFGFYHVGIFLLDKDREFAVLSAANSLGGKKMLARQHKLRVGREGLVGYAIEQKTARIALDVGDDAVFFSNPDLPDTHSEMALPLVIGNNSIGALDVQSDQPNAFSNEDIQVLVTLANQIAVAIENARLFEQSQQSMQELEKTFKRYVRQEWKSFSEDTAIKGYTAHQNELEPITIALPADGTAENNESVYKMPVTLRGVTIGVLDIDLGKNPKKYSREELDIIQATADRFALALENARLLESSQAQAARERTIGEITSKIGASVNLRNVLQTAVEALGRVLPGSDVVIHLESGR